MTVKRLSNSKLQYDDGNGVLASNYRLFFYAAGSSTKQNTYNSSSGSVANANPIVLNALGEPAVEIWLTAGLSYKVGLAIPGSDDPPASFVWTEDNLTGVNDITSSIDQWVSGPVPTFISATSFSLVGDQTTIYHVGRRIKTTNTAGTIYSTISASVFAAVTTLTVVNDSGTLDSGLSAVFYSLLSNTNFSVPALQAAGDLLSLSAAGTLSRIAVGSAGAIPMSRAAATSKLAYVAALNKAIYGWTYANAAGDVTNDIDIAAGAGMDATGAYWITGAASTKQLDVAWAVGSGVGGLDTGAIGNSDYYIWAIARSDTGVVDYLFSLSSTAPTMPTNYDFKRLIGWFKRVGAAIVLFHTYETEAGGIEMNWDSPTLDVNLANTLTTARRTDAVKVPLNFSVVAHLNAAIFDATAAFNAWIYCPDQTDLAPGVGAAPLGNWNSTTSATGLRQLFIRTSATGTIAARADLATVDTYLVSTLGFRWQRR